ncbi:MAG: hypothetical protein PWQ89_260 [Verrucomicrobiota bacterium]|nr:hypothetical protein [Verrucomicrobiota bacterium]
MGNRGSVENMLKSKMDALLGCPPAYTDHSDLLFHYTKAETVLAYILRSEKIRFNALGNTNDPLECQPLSHTGLRNVPASNDAPSVAHELRLQNLNDERQKGKLACFCKSNDPCDIGGWFDLGCFRSRMWSQYADAHKGVYLVFSKSKLLEAGQAWARTKGFDFFSGSVAYDNTLKKLQNAICITQAQPFAERVKHHSEGYYFCKREDYRDESEYRTLVYNQKFRPEDVVHIPYKNSLKGILLGTNFPREENNFFIKEASRLGVALAQVEWYSTPYLSVVESCWHPLEWNNCWRILCRLKYKFPSYFKYRGCRAAA